MSLRLDRAAVLGCLLAACSSDSTTPPPSCTVNSVAVTGAPAALEIGATAQLAATVDHDDCSTAPTVTWSTSTAARATVNGTGLVTGVAEGEVTITATAGGKSGTATFDITAEAAEVASVRITPETIVIGVGPAHTLTAQALDADDNVLPGRPVTWSVSAGTGATVAASGELTGVTAGGTATVSATVDGVAATANVYVVRRRLAFLWSDDATPGGGVAPDADYAYSSLAGAMAVSSGATGRYTALFGGFGREDFETEAYFTSAYSAPLGAFCRNSGWDQASVDVECATADGTPADMRFTVAHVSSASFTGRYAFAWIPDGSASVDAHANYVYNSAGGSIQSTRNATGRYTVRLGGLGRTAGDQREGVIVEAYEDGATCQPASWATNAADLVVEVRCFGETDGAAFDSRFSVLVVERARTGARLGFAHADQPLNGAYTPDNSAVNPTGSAVVNRNSPGQYSIAFTGIYRTGDLRETVLVTATGEAPGRCQVQEWAESTDPGDWTSVFIACATPAGVAADLPFSVVVLQ